MQKLHGSFNVITIGEVRSTSRLGVRIRGRRPTPRPSGEQVDVVVLTADASGASITSDFENGDSSSGLLNHGEERMGTDLELTSNGEMVQTESDDSFSNDLGAFERSIFNSTAPVEKYPDVDMDEFDFDTFTFDLHNSYPDYFNTTFTNPTTQPLPMLHASGSASPHLPALPMPASPPLPVATPEDEIPILLGRKRGRREVDESNIVQGARQRIKSRRARGEL
ncbi:hypothetical protein B0H14DRAFT_2618483 [Mycena olivaceomarginata]|nr:hypothetical protein B0H14DRAFT_2618483 [Mycena olivaceomarginata]